MNASRAKTSICCVCVMDDTDPDIVFDSKGVCSHCRAAEPKYAGIRLTAEASEALLLETARQIKENGKGKTYDAVAGVSGGVDSSYILWLAHKLGLRVLVVHFDNGWNSEVAVANIEAVVRHCGFDLETYVINWPEFRDLQRSFIKAGVVDIEMLSDHAIMASMFELAKRYNISTVLSGTNIATEYGMPRAWVWNKQDLTNILSIHRKFGEMKLKSYPRMGLFKSIFRRHLGFGWKFVEFLDMANYRKDTALATLQGETGWRAYGGKHFESIFTKFYQIYILPVKFGIDKRKVHLSALIRNGEITRDEALAELAQPLYDKESLRRDKAFVLKKLGFSEAEFDAMMTQPPVRHDAYGTDKKLREIIKKAGKCIGLSA